MKKSIGTLIGIVVMAVLASGPALSAAQSSAPATNNNQKERDLRSHAGGSFDVKINPEALADKGADSNLGRMSIDKQYHGDLEGTGKGEMLTAGTSVKGSGAYVAIEYVSGTLAGKAGSCVLQHRGIMTHGSPDLAITVVPDSGTGQWEGISGTMNIKIENGKHFYDFEYTLAPSK